MQPQVLHDGNGYDQTLPEYQEYFKSVVRGRWIVHRPLSTNRLSRPPYYRTYDRTRRIITRSRQELLDTMPDTDSSWAWLQLPRLLFLHDRQNGSRHHSTGEKYYLQSHRPPSQSVHHVSPDSSILGSREQPTSCLSDWSCTYFSTVSLCTHPPQKDWDSPVYNLPHRIRKLLGLFTRMRKQWIQRAVAEGHKSTSQWTLSTDASKTGWGAVLIPPSIDRSDTDNHHIDAGYWTAHFRSLSIHLIEAKALEIGIRTFE